MERTINGKKVVFREKLASADNWDTPALIKEHGEAATRGDFSKAVPLLCRVVESWEFADDPSDPAAYGKLDLFSEITPLLAALNDYVQEKTANIVPKAP